MCVSLEEFVLRSPAREVDAWWGEYGMGLGEIREAFFYISGDDGELYVSSSQGKKALGTKQPCYFPDMFKEYAKNSTWWNWTEAVPAYTSDNTHPRVIEDGVRNRGYEIYEGYGEWLWQATECHVCGILDATNRQRILAASKAMGLVRDPEHSNGSR